MIENYYFVKRRIQFILKFPQNPRTSATTHAQKSSRVSGSKKKKKKKRRKEKQGREEKKKEKKKHLINDLSIKEDPSQNGKGRGCTKAERGPRGEGVGLCH